MSHLLIFAFINIYIALGDWSKKTMVKFVREYLAYILF